MPIGCNAVAPPALWPEAWLTGGVTLWEVDLSVVASLAGGCLRLC